MATLDHIIVRVNELEVSIVFYINMMGFDDITYPDPFAIVRCATDSQLQLAPWRTPGNEHLAFAVSANELQAIFQSVSAA